MYVSAALGSICTDMDDQSRDLQVSVRCGDRKVDSTRQIRDQWSADRIGRNPISLPLNGDPLATRHAAWLRTDETFKAAVKRLAQVKANLRAKVEEEDPSDDFS